MTQLQAIKPDALPTPKEEAWKYTNLPRAVPKNLAPSPEKEEIIIHKNGGQPGGEVREIMFTGRAGLLHSPTLSITLEQGSEMTLLENHVGIGSYWKNMATTVKLGKNAKLHHIRILEDSRDAVHTNMVNIELDRDAVYEGFTLNAGASLFRHQIHAILNGENINCSFNGINLLNGKQHGDTTILIEHKAPHCQSNQFYRTVLDDEARGVFQGKVHVHKAAQKTDGYQLSNALLLSPKAEMDTKPELEIYADDVKCSHGATTGQLDEEPLFYMRSRGIDLASARMLLIQSFVDEVLEKIEDETIRGNLQEKTSQWLRNALSK